MSAARVSGRKRRACDTKLLAIASHRHGATAAAARALAVVSGFDFSFVGAGAGCWRRGARC